MDSHLQRNSTRIERGLRRVFTRPWLAALLVGIAIHGFNIMNQWFAGAGSYFASHWLAIRIQPGYGVVQVLIPFLVPWLVTGIGRHLAGINRAALRAAFPDANPDLVIKLDRDGLPLYANRAVRRWLQGEAIPLSARIVALAGVYDALRQKRIYKPAFSHERAVEIISRGDDRIDPSDFDPRVLNAFHKLSRQMDEIFNTFQAVEEIEKTG
ncbi:MAG: hypothetical protein DWQ09_08065 [Proteobacteria bacterium]|nr:MAG: hypothetical protein DWQ09_08065 [Pseudomonadota bacterium]